VIEVTTLPGILADPAEENSCLPKAARAAGMSYDAEHDRACLVHDAQTTGVPSLPTTLPYESGRFSSTGRVALQANSGTSHSGGRSKKE